MHDDVNWSGEAFKKMRKLRILAIRNATFSRGPEHLPDSLRVLEWWGYPSPSLPADFHPKNLFILNLKNSCFPLLKPLTASASAIHTLCSVTFLGLFNIYIYIYIFMQGCQNLSVMKFDSCELITQIPDVSCLPNLTEMTFSGCENLVEVHDSVGFLDKLRILRGDNCPKLRTFPTIKGTSLEILDLSYCPILQSFPKVLREAKNMTHLSLDDTDLEFPSSTQNLTGIGSIGMQSCRRIGLPISFAMLPKVDMIIIRAGKELQLSIQDEGNEKGSFVMSPKLKWLFLEECNISDESL